MPPKNKLEGEKGTPNPVNRPNNKIDKKKGAKQARPVKQEAVQNSSDTLVPIEQDDELPKELRRAKAEEMAKVALLLVEEETNEANRKPEEVRGEDHGFAPEAAQPAHILAITAELRALIKNAQEIPLDDTALKVTPDPRLKSSGLLAKAIEYVKTGRANQSLLLGMAAIALLAARKKRHMASAVSQPMSFLEMIMSFLDRARASNPGLTGVSSFTKPSAPLINSGPTIPTARSGPIDYLNVHELSTEGLSPSAKRRVLTTQRFQREFLAQLKFSGALKPDAAALCDKLQKKWLDSKLSLIEVFADFIKLIRAFVQPVEGLVMAAARSDAAPLMAESMKVTLRTVGRHSPDHVAPMSIMDSLPRMDYLVAVLISVASGGALALGMMGRLYLILSRFKAMIMPSAADKLEKAKALIEEHRAKELEEKALQARREAPRDADMLSDLAELEAKWEKYDEELMILLVSKSDLEKEPNTDERHKALGELNEKCAVVLRKQSILGLRATLLRARLSKDEEAIQDAHDKLSVAMKVIPTFVDGVPGTGQRDGKITSKLQWRVAGCDAPPWFEEVTKRFFPEMACSIIQQQEPQNVAIHQALTEMPLRQAIRVHEELNEGLEIIARGGICAEHHSWTRFLSDTELVVWIDVMKESHFTVSGSDHPMYQTLLHQMMMGHLSSSVLEQYEVFDEKGLASGFNDMLIISNHVTNAANKIMNFIKPSNKIMDCFEPGEEMCVSLLASDRGLHHAADALMTMTASLPLVTTLPMKTLTQMLAYLAMNTIRHNHVNHFELLPRHRQEIVRQQADLCGLDMANVLIVVGDRLASIGNDLNCIIILAPIIINALYDDEFSAVMAHEMAHVMMNSTAFNMRLVPGGAFLEASQEIMADEHAIAQVCPCALARSLFFTSGWAGDRPDDRALMNAMINTARRASSPFLSVAINLMFNPHEDAGLRQKRALRKLLDNGHHGDCCMSEEWQKELTRAITPFKGKTEDFSIPYKNALKAGL